MKQMINGLMRCLKEHDTGFFPSPAEFRKYCTNDPALRSWAKEENMIEEKTKNPIPMPNEFRELFKKFVGKTTI